MLLTTQLIATDLREHIILGYPTNVLHELNHFIRMAHSSVETSDPARSYASNTSEEPSLAKSPHKKNPPSMHINYKNTKNTRSTRRDPSTSALPDEKRRAPELRDKARYSTPQIKHYDIT
ncbi:hypothetical protein ASPFODRAFT_695908 [Aspergillus luchuensis CBS 106.47]|uniref:Uncharacterized protein n=1 Tax=Aspergillus luchuensis (strain CBS 106.47) TaxID=1137211 RepID=A0A1M3TZA2_ASPLC|nr:hypothetical protein ASPFODRAFT_695908 [Aspergillus luchuensis CBS 106.47]